MKMKYKLLKKALPIITAFLLVLSLLTSCGGNAGGAGGQTTAQATEQATTKAAEKPTTKAAETTTAKTEAATTQDVVGGERKLLDPRKISEPITIEYMKGLDAGLEWKSDTSPITFDVFFNGPAGYDWPGWGKDMVSAEILKRTNVTLNYTFAATSDNEQLYTMLAAQQLPDFIFSGSNEVRARLVNEEVIQPLDDLIDKYTPNFWSIIPIREKILWSEPKDGKMYTFPCWFGDPQMIKFIKGRLPTSTGMVINNAQHKELGSPSYATLDEYFDMLMQAKTKWPDMSYYAYDTGDMLYVVSRIYGGSHPNTIKNEKVHLYYRDESYKQACLFVNKLFRNGLYNEENFTITSEQFLTDVKAEKIYTFWGWTTGLMQYDMSMDTHYGVAKVPTAPGYKYSISDFGASIGGPTIYITIKNKNPERSIKHLEFLKSMEGQLLTYFGIEGRDFTIEDTVLKRSPEIEKAREDFVQFTRDYGIVNSINFWNQASNFVDNAGYYWSSFTNSLYKGLYTYDDVVVDDFMNMCLTIPSNDEDTLVIKSNLDSLLKEYRAKIITSKSEEECLAMYDEFISKAESTGLAKVEQVLTNRYLELKAADF